MPWKSPPFFPAYLYCLRIMYVTKQIFFLSCTVYCILCTVCIVLYSTVYVVFYKLQNAFHSRQTTFVFFCPWKQSYWRNLIKTTQNFPITPLNSNVEKSAQLPFYKSRSVYHSKFNLQEERHSFPADLYNVNFCLETLFCYYL